MEQTKQQCQYKREEEQQGGVASIGHRIGSRPGTVKCTLGRVLAGGREPQLATIEAAAAVPQGLSPSLDMTTSVDCGDAIQHTAQTQRIMRVNIGRDSQPQAWSPRILDPRHGSQTYKKGYG